MTGQRSKHPTRRVPVAHCTPQCHSSVTRHSSVTPAPCLPGSWSSPPHGAGPVAALHCAPRWRGHWRTCRVQRTRSYPCPASLCPPHPHCLHSHRCVRAHHPQAVPRGRGCACAGGSPHPATPSPAAARGPAKRGSAPGSLPRHQGPPQPTLCTYSTHPAQAYAPIQHVQGHTCKLMPHKQAILRA